MANRQETHVWYDGERWVLYTERGADIRRFTGWFGRPDRIGRDGSVAWWDNIPPGDMRVRKRHKRGPKAAALPDAE